MVCCACEEGKTGKLHGGGWEDITQPEGRVNLLSAHPVSEEVWVLLTGG